MTNASFPLSAMDFPMPSAAPPHPLLSVSSFIHQHWMRLGAEIASRIEEGKRFVGNVASNWPPLRRDRSASSLFASVSQESWQPKHAFDVALSTEYVAKTLAGTSVYTVSNSNNEFVLISDPNSVKSLGLLCFRQEDAEALLAQVQLRQPVLGRGARVVPITLDQVYMLKVEGIAFRFLPDPAQIRNALELKATDPGRGFDGVPVFQSNLLVVKKKNKRYCPIYFQKEDIERELSKVSRTSRGSGISQHIMVGSLEDVLKKMEMSDKNSGWDDLIFIPPGKSYSQHIQEVAAA
ncbi:PREDICTED: protein TIC 22, chloroplastic [Nelumbo nucifera]|uniref:Protein TIC 22, chloroplastic n=1 Tax=Nelumbo nucifera TaxID=4432 RepID=A0A1U8AQZ6_NELNU|nr:PREDICTED: protein TIC 22, chloroplastic [Nelumbo nucifera]XP_010270104.1 PREDICTED: protein TIC 22, chloroplastic [Nelumbo nucifera]XP_010270111.1 PREDICTED: protein TIC 22, chloroplastic [Nelumbo nucifera]XP_010270119.1 PREDICTED: protein TIC 22, chloroplastic [Nelumbo nucifera]XP_010270128.1 PREDICTED: protein TIC 22, chloroplastic [Nelumbo nucifera]